MKNLVQTFSADFLPIVSHAKKATRVSRMSVPLSGPLFKNSRWRVVSVKTIGRNVDFIRICLAEWTTYFFVIMVNLIFTSIIKTKIPERQLFKICFRNFKLSNLKNLTVFSKYDSKQEKNNYKDKSLKFVF